MTVALVTDMLVIAVVGAVVGVDVVVGTAVAVVVVVVVGGVSDVVVAEDSTSDVIETMGSVMGVVGPTHLASSPVPNQCPVATVGVVVDVVVGTAVAVVVVVVVGGVIGAVVGVLGVVRVVLSGFVGPIHTVSIPVPNQYPPVCAVIFVFVSFTGFTRRL